MKLPIKTLALVAVLSTHTHAVNTSISAWPEAPNLILMPYEAADCKVGRGIGAPPQHVKIPPNQCVGLVKLNKSYQAVLMAEPRGQTCVLTAYLGSGCSLYPSIIDDLDLTTPKSCYGNNFPFGWLGGGNEPSWSVSYNCNLFGH